MEDLISFSLRIPKSLAASIKATAERLGMSKSEYARRAMEEFEERLMQERIYSAIQHIEEGRRGITPSDCLLKAPTPAAEAALCVPVASR